jgi:5'-3' exonuclease
MGVTGLLGLIKKEYSSVYQQVPLSYFSFEVIAWDISSNIYAFMYTLGKTKWLQGILGLIYKFKKYRIHALVVFDGRSPVEKSEERQDRKEQKEKSLSRIEQIKTDLLNYHETKEITALLLQTMKYAIRGRPQASLLFETTNDVTPYVDEEIIGKYIQKREASNFLIEEDDLYILKSVLDNFGVSYVEAPGEAESLCNYLVKINKAKATFSMDSDCLASGVPIFINELNSDSCQLIQIQHLLNEMELSQEQFTLMCIIAGVDYNRQTKTVRGMGLKSSLKMVKKYDTLEELQKNEDKIRDDKGLRIEKSKELLNLEYPEYKENDFYWDPNISFNKTFSFLQENEINYNEEKIKDLWSVEVEN